MAVVEQQRRASPGDTLMTAIAPCVWGSTYVVTTELLPPGHPLTAAAIRALPAGLFMLALTRSLLPRRWWWKLIVLGLLNIGLFQALLFVAAYRLPGGVAATVGAVQPLFVVLLAWIALRVQPTRRTWLAAICGLVGVGLLVLGPAAHLDAIGVAASLGGAVAIAAGTVLTKRWNLPLSPAALTAWQLAIGGLFLLPFALAFEEPIDVLTPNNIVGFIYLSIISGGLTHALWFRGVGRLQASAVSILLLLSPLVATLLGFVVLDQRLTPVQLVGALLVLTGVWTGQRQSGTPAARREAAAES